MVIRRTWLATERWEVEFVVVRRGRRYPRVRK
jgi:hypothetical protein